MDGFNKCKYSSYSFALGTVLIANRDLSYTNLIMLLKVINIASLQFFSSQII
ncbi:hypothetical protein NIES3275_77190 (plasmid) [Microchaete diplosiphon NIES-3275]|nr:hypothetical protein NIES3275_77190 [Microchaete diplosiphon NIES-3275]